MTRPGNMLTGWEYWGDLFEDFSTNGESSISSLRSTLDGSRMVWNLDCDLHTSYGVQPMGVGGPKGNV